MNLRNCVSTLSLTTVAFAGTTSLADVTATDVWANYDAYASSVGGLIVGDLSTDGAVTTIANAKLSFALPMGLGTIAIAVSDLSMTENNDGTVSVAYPSPMTVAVSGSLQDIGAFAATLQSAQDEYTVIASGDAGDVTYAGAATNMTYTLVDVTFDGSEGWDIDASGTIAGWDFETRVTEGSLIAVQSSQTMGDSTYVFNIAGPDGMQSTNTGSYGALASTAALALPAGGSDIMNLSQAIRDGLSVEITSRGTGSESVAVTMMDGQIVTDQNTSAGASEGTIRLNNSGLVAVGSIDDIALTMTMAELLPFPIESAIEGITANYALPVNASEAQQEFRYAFGINGLTLSEQIWSLFDPTGELSRDPATIALDLSGYGVTGLDLLDFPAMLALSPDASVPVTVDEITLNSLTIAAAGAEITGQGAFTLDNNDMTTFPGFPRPQGAVDLSLSGINGLIDKLGALGFIPQEDLMMPRMMLGMFATPVGDDDLTSRIEVNGEGHVLANGQRLR